jgi:xylose isomerase
MYKPKFSVILPNYLTPLDRFTSYGGVQKGAVELIDLCGKQGVFQGVECCLTMGRPGPIPRISRKSRRLWNTTGWLAGILPITWSEKFAKGSLASPDPKCAKGDRPGQACMEMADEAGSDYVGQWPGQDGWDFYFEVDYQKQYECWVTGMQGTDFTRHPAGYRA